MAFNLSIPGQVSLHQLKAIEVVASLVPENGKVVELGSLFGRSSWAWAKSVHPSVQVYCIDPWTGNEGVRPMEQRLGVKYGIEQFKKYTEDCPNIHALQGYSPANFVDWSDPIDLYYEDAVHTDPILSENLEFWSARLKPTGVICGDDYRPRFPDVRNGAERLARRFGRSLERVDFFWCLLPDEAAVPGAAAVRARVREIAAEFEAERRAQGPRFQVAPLRALASLSAGESPTIACRASHDGLDPWPEAPTSSPIRASLRVFAEAGGSAPIAESRVDLAVNQLAPDLPSEFNMPLPTGDLAPGDYVAVLDLLDASGAYVQTPNPRPGEGMKFEVV